MQKKKEKRKEKKKHRILTNKKKTSFVNNSFSYLTFASSIFTSSEV